MEKKFIGLRYALFVGGIAGSIVLCMIPIAIYPYFYPQKWRECFTFFYHSVHFVITSML